MSDDQILSLLGRTSVMAMSSDEPATITKSTEECVRAIAGVDEALYADMPEEMVDLFKDECRAEIVRHLEDENRNPMGLTMSDVEDPEFAHRVTAVRQNAQAAAQEHTRQRQEAREADRAARQQEQAALIVERQQAAIDDAQAQLEDLKANLADRLAAIATACAEFEREKAALRERNGRSPVLNRAWGSNACRGSYAERMESQLAKVEDSVSSMEMQEGTTLIPPMPYLGNLDPAWMTKEIESLEDQIAQMREA
ncbi:hypothetical protein [Aureimonas altamirensis]|uniref:hypothetical protein n=1 Tax=Aureimonas altamirensis TaxID=370622 RepID=UPI002557C346|nr:hypothetical protein [Aureimonas altamirensis]